MKNSKATGGTSRLAAWMTTTHTTYTKLAADLGVSANSAYCWMTGRARPRVELWARIEQLTEGAVPALAWTQPATEQRPDAA